MKTENKEHTFVVCAYGESPYLEKCIDSLEKQTVKSRILIATSTPNPYIEKIAAVHNLEIRINAGEKGIAGDWNFAYGCADTPYVTLAHQDDVYREEYTEKVVKNLNSCEVPLIAFTDYYEIRDNKTVKENRLLHIKRGMLFPLKWRGFWRSRFVRRRILSIGSAICCPSVTLVKNNINEERVFENNMKSNITASQPEVILPFWTASFQTTESSSWILECSTRSSANRIRANWTTPARCSSSHQIP